MQSPSTWRTWLAFTAITYLQTWRFGIAYLWRDRIATIWYCVMIQPCSSIDWHKTSGQRPQDIS